MKVRCPKCGKKTVYAESNPNRPFCSERCKQIDLGTWASEGYVIPGEPADPSSPTPLPPGEG